MIRRLRPATLMAVLLAPATAGAHFILQAPASWAEQDSNGSPQKSAPCGQADPQAAVPTNAVTDVHAGDSITVTVDEVVFHPGHYRVVLSTTGQAGLGPDPETTLPGTCMDLAVQDPPVFPVIVDGVLPHTDPFTGPQSFQVTLPADVTCAGCTLQVLEFMQADVGASGNCFYHHCADLRITSPAGDAGVTDAGAGAAGSGGCGCALSGRASPGSAISLLVVLALVAARRRRRSPSPVIALSVVAIVSGCGDDRPDPPRFGVSPGNVEAAWLARVADGPAATAAACGRGAADPVARALCQSPAPTLTGLADLYGALDLVQAVNARAAVATHSLGLSARSVSALNPRVIAFRDYSPLDQNGIVAVAFARGEPFVELVGYDPATRDFNDYLLVFQPSCDLGESGGRQTAAPRSPCTPADLLTERIESGWGGWALYADRDLEDTPLDCTSCHRPDGPGAQHRLLMRQLDGPWMHWGDFRGLSAPITCTDATGAATLVTGQVSADGADLLGQVDGPDGRHAAIPVTALIAAASGYDLSSFLFYAAGLANGTGDVPCQAPDCPTSEPLPFSSEAVLCDRLRDGRGDVPGGAWASYRAGVLPRGFPVPYFDPDILAPATRARVGADFGAFVAAAATPPPGGDEADAFTALGGLVDPDVAAAIGFLPDPDDSAETLLGKMCARCHGDGTDARLGRSRFDAQALDRLDAATAAKVRDRISLPRTSPDLMPPLRAGELPAWAIAQIGDFLGPTIDGAR